VGEKEKKDRDPLQEDGVVDVVVVVLVVVFIVFD
jgi:hypothetical protein